MIPTNPLTIALNAGMTKSKVRELFNQFVPAEYDYITTSTTRTPAENRAVGGVPDSAHLYGLAEDLVITKGGDLVPQPVQSHIFETYIKPNWIGFALDEGDHIHLNLPRQFTHQTKWAAWTVTAVGVGIAMRQWLKSRKTRA